MIHDKDHSMNFRKIIKQQPVTYGNAETRGKLRQWKGLVASRYSIFDRTYRNKNALLPHLKAMTMRGTKGRRRGFDKLQKAFGPGAILERGRLEGKYPLAVWSILKSRDSVTVDAPVETGLMQDCITVNAIVAGVLPDDDGTLMVGVTEGMWTLEVPDHALGRAVERSGVLPDAIIAEAHHNILRLREAVVLDNSHIDVNRHFLLKAGAGGFICHLTAAQDVSLGYSYDVRCRAVTWLADDMLRDEQKLLVDDGLPGQRLGDSWLLPASLRRINKYVTGLELEVWGPGGDLFSKR